jgi:hypothetical protein
MAKINTLGSVRNAFICRYFLFIHSFLSSSSHIRRPQHDGDGGCRENMSRNFLLEKNAKYFGKRRSLPDFLCVVCA